MKIRVNVGNRPTLVAHADWGSDPRKRQLAWATLDSRGRYVAGLPEPVGPPADLLDRLRLMAGEDGSVLLGFDFPIGLPLAYARLASIDDFVAVLLELGRGRWADFYRVAVRPAEIGLERPFYPFKPGGTRQQHLLDGLGVASIGLLRRACDQPGPVRRAAAPLFWTLGAQQAGKAAIIGWRDVIAPALRLSQWDVAIWPFHGRLESLIHPGRVVIAETYPAEFYTHLGIAFPPSKAGRKSGKRVQEDRVVNAQTLLSWAGDAEVNLQPALAQAIENGFGPSADGEDPFDAVVGLFGMLNVVTGRRPASWPTDREVQQVEGWILGQSYPASWI